MKIIESTLQFAKEFPAAFAALPEAYQSDECLIFSIYHNCITAEPKKEQVIVLGDWQALWFPGDVAWS